MRTLVLGDLHHHIGLADAIRAGESHEHLVCLGDYFDDFHDNPEMATRTAKWVQARLAEPNCELLFGNHDLPYAFPEVDDLLCAGYSPRKAIAIAEVLGPEDWAKLSLHTWVGPWLVSHAGFDRRLLPAELVRDRGALAERCHAALAAAARRQTDPLLEAGRDRGGRAEVGGVTWCDWLEFQPISGLAQIVGHTPSRHESLRCHDGPGANVCIDHLNGRTYAVVEEARTTFKKWWEGGAEKLLELPHADFA